MISEVKGDVIAMAETGIIDGLAHGCNCLHAMGSGIAGQLARRYPEVPLIDQQETSFRDFSKIGSFTVAECNSVVDEDKWFDVFNCYTQKVPSYDGSDVFEYDAFPTVLKGITQYLVTFGFTADRPYRLGFPQIGAGLAGGDWPRIRQMIIDEYEANPDIEVVLVEYQP